MKDLAPYICTFENCSKPQESFQTFPDWIAHIRIEHTPLQWDCLALVHDPQHFNDQELYMDHMRHDHPGTFADSQLPALAQMSARPESRIFAICPFCNNLPKDLAEDGPNQQPQEKQEELQKHIAQHLQSLALISLQWLDGSKSDGPSDRDSDLGLEDLTEVLTFRDPPDRSWNLESELDPDWNQLWPAVLLPTGTNTTVDPTWETSRLSQGASSEWDFIMDPVLSLYPDHTHDEALEPFLKAIELKAARAFYGYLFGPDKKPTRVLDAMLRGIAKYIVCCYSDYQS
jgi:hypothetical protein